MNWGDLGGWIAAAAAIIGAVFVYGKFAQQLTDSRQGIRDLWKKNNEQDREIAKIDKRVAVMEREVRR